ncbi:MULTISPECIES: type II toxin-antitoxin system VapC family toxin [Metallosphaera]|uniref:type II toxin-antitoxin system VapC family toxin n=1 Tax=Metallosphaera TaxID=41980 RepID=UPI001F055E0A|nr:type II toxin-antitoxin system VapC family toxin [Metallosphaera sedula]MCH1771063.1 type II toxin-antitoxin system VapC family toxin [Metallosphaera sedula]MCP6729433.1 type II toxin-antitoxin system VapC family toxin [Metallosphaera sedula]
MRRELRGSLVFDSGVLISLLQGELEDLYRRVRNEEIDPVINVVNLTEVYYVLCRRLGAQRAEEIVNSVVKSGYFSVVGVSKKIYREVSLCKCKHAISLSDCFSIATAKARGIKALFRREKELEGIREESVEFVD